MNQRKDGGTAFPMQDQQAMHAYAAAAIVGIDDVDERDRVYMQARAEAVGGMTLRDYFATHIEIENLDNYSVELGTVLLGSAPPADRKQNLMWWARHRSACRYIEADAMLEARKS